MNASQKKKRGGRDQRATPSPSVISNRGKEREREKKIKKPPTNPATPPKKENQRNQVLPFEQPIIEKKHTKTFRDNNRNERTFFPSSHTLNDNGNRHEWTKTSTSTAFDDDGTRP